MRRAECWGLGAEVRLKGGPKWSQRTCAVPCGVGIGECYLRTSTHPAMLPVASGNVLFGGGGGALCKRQN